MRWSLRRAGYRQPLCLITDHRERLCWLHCGGRALRLACSAIVAKHEFVEIRIDVLAAQTMVCAEAPSPHQRKSPMDPRQDNVRSHFADDAWIVPVAWQT